MLLVSNILRAHGGRERWALATSFSAHISVSGALLPQGGPGPAELPSESRLPPRQFVAEGDTHRPHLKLFGSDDAAHYSVYTPHRIEVWTRTGHLVEALDRPIDSLATRHDGRPLQVLEQTFLIGNAIWSAICGPFVLTDARVAAADLSDGENLTLDATLPESLDPLCPRRHLLLSEDGILHRSDYEIRHICPSVTDTLSAHIRFDGILVATLRRVCAVNSDGRTSNPPLLDMEIFDVRFW